MLEAFMLIRLVAVFGLVLQAGCGGDGLRGGQADKGISSSARPRMSLAVLPFTGMWDRPGSVSDDWNQNIRDFLTTALPNDLIKALHKKTAPGGFTMLPLDKVRGKLEAAKSPPDADARLLLPDD